MFQIWPHLELSAINNYYYYWTTLFMMETGRAFAAMFKILFSKMHVKPNPTRYLKFYKILK